MTQQVIACPSYNILLSWAISVARILHRDYTSKLYEGLCMLDGAPLPNTCLR